MNETCPDCDLKFEREQGYFVGAMYVSYLLGSILLTLLCILVWLLVPHLSFEMRLVIAVVLSLPFAPALFRHSRILWIHFDRSFDSFLDSPKR